MPIEDGTWLDIVRRPSRHPPNQRRPPTARRRGGEEMEMDALVAEVMEFKQSYAVEH